MADINMGMSEALRAEMANITSTQRAAVLMLLLGEEQAADIIKFLNPKEVQSLGAAMVAAADFSQEAVNVVLDEFVDHLKKQSSLSMGSTDYVENVARIPVHLEGLYPDPARAETRGFARELRQVVGD